MVGNNCAPRAAANIKRKPIALHKMFASWRETIDTKGCQALLPQEQHQPAIAAAAKIKNWLAKLAQAATQHCQLKARRIFIAWHGLQQWVVRQVAGLRCRAIRGEYGAQALVVLAKQCCEG